MHGGSAVNFLFTNWIFIKKSDQKMTIVTHTIGNNNNKINNNNNNNNNNNYSNSNVFISRGLHI